VHHAGSYITRDRTSRGDLRYLNQLVTWRLEKFSRQSDKADNVVIGCPAKCFSSIFCYHYEFAIRSGEDKELTHLLCLYLAPHFTVTASFERT
jgi:hypothetical protein